MGISKQREAGRVRIIRVGSSDHPAANHKGLNEGRGVPSGIPSGMRRAMRTAITPRPPPRPKRRPRGHAAASKDKAAPHKSKSTTTATPHSPYASGRSVTRR